MSFELTEVERAVISRVIRTFILQSKDLRYVPRHKPTNLALSVTSSPSPPELAKDPKIGWHLLCALSKALAEKALYFPSLTIEPLKTFTMLPSSQRSSLHDMGIFIYSGQDHEVRPADFTRGATEPPPWKTFSEARRGACLKFILTDDFLEKRARKKFLNALWDRHDLYISYVKSNAFGNVFGNFPLHHQDITITDAGGSSTSFTAPNNLYAVTEWRTSDIHLELKNLDWQVAKVANMPLYAGPDWNQWFGGRLNEYLRVVQPIQVTIAARKDVGNINLVEIVREEAERAGLRKRS